MELDLIMILSVMYLPAFSVECLELTFVVHWLFGINVIELTWNISDYPQIFINKEF